jgi:LCP family protein required for cell wall assembly
VSAPPTYPSLPPELDPRRPRRTVVPQTPVRRRRRFPRVLAWIAAITSGLVLVATIGGYLAYRHYDNNIGRIRNIVLPGHSQPPPSGKDVNYLLVGSDTREGYTKAELQAAGTQFDGGNRSDTVILVHIPADGSKVTLVSFPRDSWVRIPQWTDPKGKVHPEHFGKLNSAFASGELPGGNPALLSATIGDLSGLRVDHFVQIDFIGFMRMVNALGGIRVCLQHAARDRDSGINLPAGESDINGKQALAFVRQRHGLPGEDLGRIKRQQYFIATVIKKVTSAGTLLNPFKLTAFLDKATQSVKSDQGLTQLRTLALRLRKLDPQHVQFATLPNLGGAKRGTPSQDVVLLDEPRVAALFGGLRGDSPKASATPSPSGPRLVVPASAVRVRVYNGTSQAGLAAKASDDLRAAGFIVATPRTRNTGATATVVRYGPTRADSARTLAAAVPGAELVADPTLGSTVELIVGSGYTGAHAVEVTPPTSAPPSAPPTASVAPSPPVTAQDLSCAP